MGSMIHMALDSIAQHGSLLEVYAEILTNYEKLIRLAADENQVNDYHVEAETCFRLIQGYIKKWVNDGLIIVKSEVAFERKLENPLSDHKRAGSRTFRHAGVIDKIIVFGDRMAIMEHKTTSSDIGPNSEYWSHLRIDHQITGYLLGAQSLNYDVETVLYDVIRKPSIKPKKLVKKDLVEWQKNDRYYGEEIEYDPMIDRETARLFGARLIDTIQSDSERYYQRQEIPRLSQDYHDYSLEMLQISQQIRQCQRYGRWYRNSRACLQPFRCEYADLCFGGLSPESCVDFPPNGFHIVEDKHPELGRAKHGKSNGTTQNGAESRSAEIGADTRSETVLF